MSLLKTNEIQNYNGSSLTLTASTVSTSAQLNTGGNISVTGSLNVSDDSTTRTNLGLGTIATQDSNNVNLTGGTIGSGVVFPALGNSAVGTVSVSSGTPTGDIIERGSNANGEYVKHADGTMICWEEGKLLIYGSGSTFRVSTKTFPISFVSVNPCVSMSGDPTASGSPFDISNDQRVYAIGLSSFNYLTASAFSSDRTQGFSWIAIGRWY